MDAVKILVLQEFAEEAKKVIEDDAPPKTTEQIQMEKGNRAP